MAIEEILQASGASMERKESGRTDDWLSLEDFPDDTRVNLTKRGRGFIFTTQKAQSFQQLFSYSTWSRYKSDTDLTIPLSTIRNLVNNDGKDLFIVSFTVTSVGSQKTQLKGIKLPLKVEKSFLTGLLALMCLTRGVFNNGTFQSDRDDKTEAFVKAFDDVFGVELATSVNKRGNYLKVPKQLCSAIIHWFTKKEGAPVWEIIRGVKRCSEPDILDFLNSWFAYSRIYRYDPDHRVMFMFRANDETRAIAELLEHVGISFEAGSLTEGGRFVPVYMVLNNEKNKAILNIPQVGADSKRNLVEEVSRLRVKVRTREDRIGALEEVTEELREELQKTKDKKQQVSFSKYYYERATDKLREKLPQLENVLSELQDENESLKEMILSKSYETGDEKQLSDDKKEILRLKAIIEGLRSEKEASEEAEVTLRMTKEVTMRRPEVTPPTSKNLLKFFQGLLARQDNWILLSLAAEEPRSFQDLTSALGITGTRDSHDLRKKLNQFVDERVILESVDSDGEPVYILNFDKGRDAVKEFRQVMSRREIPLDLRYLAKKI